MSDMWTFSSPSPAVIHHHSSPFTPSPPPVFSSSSLRNHDKVITHHLPPPQVLSPLLDSQTQVTSPHLPLPHQVTSPYLPDPQVTSPYLGPGPQVMSPPPYLCQTQVTSPQLLLSSHLPGPGPDLPPWSGPEPPCDLSYLLNNYSYQNQDPSYLDFHLQTQTQFSAEVTPHRPAQVLGDSPGPDVEAWGGPLDPAVPQLQCSPLGSVSLGRQRSVEDFYGGQCFPYGYHDNGSAQMFCSPSTPGLSPHYPAVSSPGPQMPPRTGFQTQKPSQLSPDQTVSYCLQESTGYPVTSDPGRHRPSQNLLPSQTQVVQHQPDLRDAAGGSERRFPPQGPDQNIGRTLDQDQDQVLSAAAAGSWKEEGGGGGRRRGGGGAGHNQPDLTWNWIKQPQHENRMKAPDCRLLCTVCKRDFRSLPALNGHMRSHSGFRSATWMKKGNNPSPPLQTSVAMVMPVSVPVQSRGASKACRSGLQRRSVRPSGGGAALYCSLMRPDAGEAEEEVVARGNRAATSGRVHYTPPPMLCPLRAGSGLYCSITTRRQHRVQTLQLHNSNNGLGDLVSMETTPPPHPGTLTTGIIKPRVNVGGPYQVEIPPLRDRKHASSDSHNALLLWTPWDVLEQPVNQQRVEALLSMARSRVVPGGGASVEHALHILSECRGDFLLTVEKLLSSPESSNNNQSGAAVVSWSAAERKLLLKSLQLHHKDFSSVQRDVQTKSISQCVEFYYLWKKKELNLRTHTQTGLTVALPDKSGQRS